MRAISKACRVLSLVAIGLIAASVPARAQSNVGSLAYYRGLFAGDGTFTGQLKAPTTPNDCTAPTYSFQGDTDTGIGYNAADSFRLCAGGFSVATVGSSGGLFVGNAFFFGWGTDVFIAREGASHPIQRSGTSAQRASWANTYTSSTNNETFSIDWQTTANLALVGARTAATGNSRRAMLVSQNDNANNLYAGVSVFANADPRIRAGLYNAGGVVTSVSANGTLVQLGEWTNTVTSGSTVAVSVVPTYNQAAATTANTDFLINRTETAVGSGNQNLFDGQVGGTSQFRITSTGAAISRSAYLVTTATGSGIGYSTGSSCSVTQLTSKATGVTCSGMSGQITMHNAALAAATVVSFVLTNTTLTANDCMIVEHTNAGTLAGYTVAYTPAAGSATIFVRNNTAGSLSEAIVIRFAKIACATS